MTTSKYQEQVQLLIEILPHVAKERCLALKGGTAINLFVRDMPRLSVDIDLQYIFFDNRQTAFTNINQALERIAKALEFVGISSAIRADSEGVSKVIGSNKVASVKIEPNYVIRGCIVPPQFLPNAPKVQEIHGFVAINVLSFGELFGGKICAELDRQHPRDLFDAKHLLAKEGITREVVCGFIASLLSHNRPPHEVLNPNVQPQETAFFEEFAGMAEEDFSDKDHMDVLHNLIAAVNSALSLQDKAFLISFFETTPKWDLIEIDKICELPSVNWKLKNLNLLKERNPQKFAEQVEQLQRVLA